MVKIPTLAEAYNFSTSLNGVFADLQKLEIPWKNENMEQSLDLAYIGLHSGTKPVMPFIGQLVLNNNGTLSPENRATIAQMLINMYGIQWQKQWNTLSFDYNPIENYDMTESEEVIENGGETYNNATTNKADNTETIIQGGTVTVDHPVTTTRISTNTAENSGNTSNNVYGFNSADAVPSDNQTQTQNGTQNINDNTTQEDKSTETRDTTDTHKIDGTDTSTNNGFTNRRNNLNRSLSRHGNIGVTTSQQMIDSERKLWIWNYFKDVVFPDIDKMLTLAIY